MQLNLMHFHILTSSFRAGLSAAQHMIQVSPLEWLNFLIGWMRVFSRARARAGHRLPVGTVGVAEGRGPGNGREEIEQGRCQGHRRHQHAVLQIWVASRFRAGQRPSI